MQKLLIALVVVLGLAGTVWAQTTAGGRLRVTVVDATEWFLPHAVVTVTDAAGVSREAPVDAEGVATFTGLPPGPYQIVARADGFRDVEWTLNVRAGDNPLTLVLPVAFSEEVTVIEESAETRRDNGFTQALSQEEVDGLSDDPEEMAQQLAQMAGPNAQIFVDGFGGGRLPPKDQIQRIRFNSNSYSAEYHDAGLSRVEVVTRPGMGGWRGRMNFGFRDESLNARNAFSSVKEPTAQQRYNLSFQGPVVKGRSGISISVDSNNSFDSRTILAQDPTGGFARGLARNTTDSINANVRFDQAVGQTGQVRLEYQRRGTDRGNLGVGDFDLPERSYETETINDMFRVRNTRVLGRDVFSELRFEVNTSETTTLPQSLDPTIRVNDAFTAGGAGQSGERSSREIELAQNFDFTIGRRHSLRAGVRLEAGWWKSTQQQNTNGTYVFTNYDNYLAGLPATYTIRIGDPLVEYSQIRAGWYIQDDMRVGRNWNVSLGVRQEVQTQMADRFNLAPRVAFTWNATRKTTVRGGYGIFYDWFDSNLYEQTVRVDGFRQQDLIIQDPGFPAVAGSGGITLPTSVIRAASLTQPVIQQASIGIERPLTSWSNLRMDYMWTRGTNTLRSVNVNAPVDGVRPDPAFGNITEIQSTGRSATDRLTINLNARYEPMRLFSNVMYQLQSSRNFSDSATALPSDSVNPDVDWGPSGQDIRHRVFMMVNAPIWQGIRAGFNVQIASARPYNVTTGRDDNGDTVFNDRPAGVGRNSERGAGSINASLRLNKTIGFGGPAGGGPGGPGGPVMVPPPDGGGAAAGVLNQRGPGGGGGGGPQIMVMEGGNARYRLDFYAQISNLFNNVNYGTFVGNVLSPFYGRATSAAPARRTEVGFSLGF